MLSNRPLFATLADSHHFVWSQGATALRNALVIGRNTLVIGAHGSGKTTSLHMVEFNLQEQHGRPVAFASLAGLDDANAVALAVHAAAVERAWLSQPSPESMAAVITGADPMAPLRLLRQLRDCPKDAIFLLDDVGASAGAALFGRLRDELWQMPFTWAAATLPDEASAMVTPPADAFFERRVFLGDLTPDERQKLLDLRREKRRDRLTSAQARELARTGPGNARQLIELARHAGAGGPAPEALSAGASRRMARAEEAGGRPGTILISGMEGLGPVSASDPRLLDRIGWDRPRAARTLAKLEQAGVVRSYLEPREGRIGRPRKLYELSPVDDFVTS
jgi:hypothetical protein